MLIYNIRKKGKGAKEAFKGAGIGLLSGLLIAVLDGPPSADCFLCISRQDKLKIYGISSSINGTAIGLLFGNRRKKIPINPQKRKRSFKKEANIKR